MFIGVNSRCAHQVRPSPSRRPGQLICLRKRLSTLVTPKQWRAGWMRIGFSWNRRRATGVANPVTNRQTGSNRGRATNIICSSGDLRPDFRELRFPSVLDRPLRHLSALESTICERAWNSVAQNPPSNPTVPRCELYSTIYGLAKKDRRGNCVRPLNVPRSLTGVCKSLRTTAPPRRTPSRPRPARRTGALIVLGICDIVWLWKATP